MICSLKDCSRLLGGVSRSVIAVSALFSFGAHGIPLDAESKFPESGTHSGAIVICTSQYYPPGTESPVKAHYAVTLFDASVDGSVTLNDTSILKRPEEREEMIKHILTGEGISEEYSGEEVGCQAPLFIAINTAEAKDGDLQMDAIQYQDTSIYYTITAKRDDADFQYLTRKQRDLNEVEAATSGALSPALRWSTNGKLTIIGVTTAVTVIVFGPYAAVVFSSTMALIPGGSVGVAAITALGSFTAYKLPDVRKRVGAVIMGTPAFMVRKFDALLKLFGATEEGGKASTSIPQELLKKEK